MSLEVRSSGRGRDLVLLHGWGMDAGVWDDIAPALARSFRVHAVNLPGYGASATCAPYNVDTLAGVLASTLPAACMVCAWSLGAQAALVWAQRAPRQVVRLALIGATPCFVRRADWPHAMEEAVLRQFADALATDREATLRRFFALQAMGDDSVRAVTARLRAGVLGRPGPPAAVLESGLALLLDTDLRGRLARIASPALVIHGDRDRLVPLAAAEHLSRALPAARLEVLQGAAHAPFLSRADHTASVLEAFFDER